MKSLILLSSMALTQGFRMGVSPATAISSRVNPSVLGGDGRYCCTRRGRHSAEFVQALSVGTSRHGDSSNLKRRSVPRMSVSSPAAQALNVGKELKLGVLLLNLGGPERQDDVEPFLYNLFADPDIIRLPPFLQWLQSPIAKLISSRRAPKSRSAYASIGGGSPIVPWTNAQATGIAEELRSKGIRNAKCYVAMRYWHPFTETALKEIEDDGVNALVIIPLYPQFSISTSGSSLRLLNEEFTRNPDKWGTKRVVHTVVPSWYNRPGYVEAVTNLIAEELKQFTPAQVEEGVQVLFSAHGVPKSYIELGDPYKAQIEECVGLISRKTQAAMGTGSWGEGEGGEQDQAEGGAGTRGGVSYHLSYQSRVGPVEWLRPYTDTMITGLASGGCKNLVVVPISFVSEHIETLEEIDMEYRELAEESGVVNWRRVPALNTDPAFIKDMANMVVEALAAPTVTVSEAFTRNNCDRKEQDSFLERMLEAGAGLGGLTRSKGQLGGEPGVGAGAGAGMGNGGRIASTVGGVAFMADGLGREIFNALTGSDALF
ncbi:unnamed protein product [Discosporangium mesarthrocarpum]